MPIRTGELGTGPLTKLDEQVLGLLSRDRARRVEAIVSLLNRHERRFYQPLTGEADVRGILRGFEHLGRATCRRGWWRLT